MFVKANAGAENKYYIAGHVFRIISCLNQVLFACNNAYCINEKKAIKLLETFEYKPKKMPKGEIIFLKYSVFHFLNATI